jgi:hypothetical protein
MIKTGEYPMRFVPIAALALSVLAVTGCTRWSMNHHLNNAYSAYDRGNCEQVMLELSKVERASRARPYVWPEVSMMRGQCLERQKCTSMRRRPTSSSSPRTPTANTPSAPARLETLQSLGHYPTRSAAAVRSERF